MNKRKSHLILSWLLLLFFAVGQFVIYAHQHRSKYNTTVYRAHHADQHQVVEEKCSFCDQMHHAPINLVQPLSYAYIVTSTIRVYIPAQHHHKADPLVHADGLSPPAIA